MISVNGPTTKTRRYAPNLFEAEAIRAVMEKGLDRDAWVEAIIPWLKGREWKMGRTGKITYGGPEPLFYDCEFMHKETGEVVTLRFGDPDFDAFRSGIHGPEYQFLRGQMVFSPDLLDN